MSLGKAETVAQCIWQKRRSVSSSRWIFFTYSPGKEPIENVWKEEAHSEKQQTHKVMRMNNLFIKIKIRFFFLLLGEPVSRSLRLPVGARADMICTLLP